MMSLIQVANGTAVGRFALDFHQRVLVPLAERGLVSNDDIFAVYDRAWKELCRGDFSGEPDVEVAYLLGSAFWSIQRADQAAFVSHAMKNVRRVENQLLEPLLRSRNYKKWKELAASCLRAMLVICGVLRASAASYDHDLAELAAYTLRIADNEELLSSEHGQVRDMLKRAADEVREAPASRS